MFDAVCTNCKKRIKVPFKPDPNRPVYCKDCFAKKQEKPFEREKREVFLSKLRPRERQRKTVDTEGLKKILEKTIK
jgi:CxxC-x17-CxxC domain-containing protein